MSDQEGSSGKMYFEVAVLVFHGVDMLDFVGPVEVLSHASHNRNPDAPDRVYRFTMVGREGEIRAAANLKLRTDLQIEDVLNSNSGSDASKRLCAFDMLIVPGGPPSVIMPLLDKGSPEMRFLTAFSVLPPKPSQKSHSSHLRPRLLVSICTGAFLLGAQGILAGIRCTTHHRALLLLSQICGTAQPAQILEKRYVDGGFCKSLAVHPGALQVVTSGGICSGLDMAIWIVGQQMGSEDAKFIARVMEYDWPWDQDDPRGERGPK